MGVLLILCWGLLGLDQARALDYSGTWQTREDGAGKLLQSYRHSVGVNSSQKLTSLLSMDEALRYGYTKSYVGDASDFVRPHGEYRSVVGCFVVRRHSLASTFNPFNGFELEKVPKVEPVNRMIAVRNCFFQSLVNILF